MDVRDRLVELLNGVLTTEDATTSERVADHLIAYGIVVREDCKACAEKTRNCIIQLQELIAELRSAQGWIPVTERLPEKPTKCLVYTKRGEYYGYEITYYNQGFYPCYAEVTHWMPIPEPPKDQEDL